MQSFNLETGDVGTFLRVTQAVIESLFDVESGRYSQLYLTTKRNSLFRDGKKWIGNNKELLNRLGVDSLSASDPRGWSKPKRFFICTIADYKTEMSDDNLAIPFNNFIDLMGRIKLLLKDDPNQKVGNKMQFLTKCGSGYNYAFNQNDGDIEMGYCCQYRPNGAWHNLDISFHHIYYGK